MGHPNEWLRRRLGAARSIQMSHVRVVEGDEIIPRRVARLLCFFFCCRKKTSERSSIQKSVNTRKMYLLWFNFIFGSNFIFLCFKLIIIHYNTQKLRKIKFEPRIRLNHTISMPLANPLCLSWNVSVDPFLFHTTEENH